MNEISVLNYESNEVRTIQLDGELWWVAKDVCDVFGETNRNRAMQGLDEDEKGYTQMNTPGGKQKLAVVNEGGLYSLLFAMQPEKARGVSDEYISERQAKLKQFKRWVTHEVLPSIRKHGMYARDELLNNPDFLVDVAKALRDERAEKERLQAKIKADKPKVVFADAVDCSGDTILVRQLAKILKGNGIDIGEKRLYERLRKEGFLIKCSSDDRNMPTQRAMDMGLFKVKETAITHSDGRVTMSATPKVTGKGQKYLVNYFLKEGA